MAKVSKFIYWTPRILAIIFIVFLALFSFDVFDSCNGFWNCSFGLFVHNLPSLVLLVFLLISWKYEIVGGIAFILGGLLYAFMTIIRAAGNGSFEWFMLSWIIAISGIAFFIGILFLTGWKRKKS